YPYQAAMHSDGRLYIVFPGYGGGGSFLGALTFENSTPTIGGISFQPSAPRSDSLLRAVPAYRDPDWDPASGVPDPTVLTYQWFRNGAALPGTTAATLDLSVPGSGDRGDTIGVRVTATDPQGASASAMGSVTI